MYILGIQSIIIEGGAFTLNEFIRYNLWDEARIITSTDLNLHDGVIAPKLTGSIISDTSLTNNQIQIITL